jgi:hypothetical protein
MCCEMTVNEWVEPVRWLDGSNSQRGSFWFYRTQFVLGGDDASACKTWFIFLHCVWQCASYMVWFCIVSHLRFSCWPCQWLSVLHAHGDLWCYVSSVGFKGCSGCMCKVIAWPVTIASFFRGFMVHCRESHARRSGLYVHMYCVHCWL